MYIIVVRQTRVFEFSAPSLASAEAIREQSLETLIADAEPVSVEYEVELVTE